MYTPLTQENYQMQISAHQRTCFNIQYMWSAFNLHIKIQIGSTFAASKCAYQGTDAGVYKNWEKKDK